MSLYNRWGRVRIVANCGQHHPKYLEYPDTLLRVDWADNQGTDPEFYVWKSMLRADEGWGEILAAVVAVPVLELAAAELKRAFRSAE